MLIASGPHTWSTLSLHALQGEENSAEQGPMTSLAIHALRNERFRDIVMSPKTRSWPLACMVFFLAEY